MSTRFIVAVCVAAASTSALALPGTVGKGPNVTYGYTSHGINLHSLSNNPAHGIYVLRDDSTLRMGRAGAFSLGYEMGQVDNFLDRADEVLDNLERDNLSVAEGIALANETNDLVELLGQDGYLRTNIGLQAPLTPVAFRNDLGTFTLSVEADIEVRASILDDAVTYDAINQELRTRTSMYLKSATLTQLSAGWARELWQQDGHVVIGGARVRLINGALSKQVVNLKTAATDDDDDIGDIISDQYDVNERTSTNIGIDLGAVYQRDNWRAGLTLQNINEPSFRYGSVGVGCASLTPGSREQTNCLTADYFVQEGRIAANEKWVLASQATVDGSYDFSNGRGLVGFSYDLTDANTPTGDREQMFSLVTAYQLPNVWLPGLRAGYHANQRGSKLSSISAGMTWFNRLTLDALVGLENVRIDGSSLPRTAALSLGWQSRF
ncbi:conjugal transfer protein TraF [Alcanivorax sp. JB21]|uniref:conjugal transfer protein TraF n=1 Tax=Alcanivorax limicola TaxID=2874102 RepID=UPI001CBB58D2|nr:conjugal transfer protein TraF [Alcanivorax limicola]MBZ2190242.1 conjugal transfer protein TraF [Alcanivorax limicola]